MRKVLILVEGQTEEQFVKEVLNPHLNNYEKHLIPTIVNTKIVKSGPNFKGGIVSYVQVRRDLLRLLGDTSALCVTTMFDLYGLPGEFPGRQDAPAAPYDKVQHIENAFRQDINHPRFLVNLILHEFEGSFSLSRQKSPGRCMIQTKNLSLLRLEHHLRLRKRLMIIPRLLRQKGWKVSSLSIINLFTAW